MGIIIGIIIFLVIVGLFNSANDASKNSGTNSYPNNDDNTFTNRQFSISSKKVTESLSNENIEKYEFIKVFINGIINVPYDGYNTEINVFMFDVTDGKKDLILCSLDSMQYKDSTMFYYSRAMKMPYKGTVVDMMEFIRVPSVFLQFPKSGRRDIKISVEVIGQGRVLESATNTLSHYVVEKGYLEKSENQKKLEETAIKMGLLVGSIDGSLDAVEGKIIKEWVSKRLYRFSDSNQEKEKQRLNEYVRIGHREALSGSLSIHSLLMDIDDYADEMEKYEIYELCLKVARADETATSEELELLKDIAQLLKLNPQKIQAMTEKELPVMMHEASALTDEVKIGITSSMSSQEKKKHIMTEYRKWNRRVSNKDPQIREQAEEMIKIIAELRKKYR